MPAFTCPEWGRETGRQFWTNGNRRILSQTLWQDKRRRRRILSKNSSPTVKILWRKTLPEWFKKSGLSYTGGHRKNQCWKIRSIQISDLFVNPEMTPTADMRKVRIDVNETHLGRKNWDTIQSGFVIVSRRTYIVEFYHFDKLCKVENIFHWKITLVSCCDLS